VLSILRFKGPFLTVEHSLRAACDKGGPDYVHRFFRYVFTGGICDEAIRDAVRLEQPEGVLTAVGHVEKPVLVLVLLVDGGHQSGCWWEGVLYKDEDRLLSTELDPLPYHINKLSNCEVGRNKVPVCSQALGTIHLV
jgi:hypothetical protein